MDRQTKIKYLRLAREDNGWEGTDGRIQTPNTVWEGDKCISFDLYSKTKVSRAGILPIVWMRKLRLRVVRGCIGQLVMVKTQSETTSDFKSHTLSRTKMSRLQTN